MAVYASQLGAKGPFANSAPPSIPTHAAPSGTFLPGTKVHVGNHRVIIDRYLSEGGFAHVYVVSLPTPVDGNQKAVLKRVAVPDKDHLANMRTEVETMKRLRGKKHIVKYIDSHASQLKGGGYEVFLLMEFCQGGGLIDFMNTRLQNRLTEPEILKIFTDVAEGVACMHYLKPPLMHRDLKVENVLISTSGSSRIYKLCDFGSAAPSRPAATSAAEGRLIEDDINRHTTLQYRSPEMIDVYRKQPIDEKADIWALGVFLYKLCYYTTPFEEAGQMAILNARFKFPGYPRFSDQLKLLIASMLRERPSERPNIYQVLQKACQMDGRELALEDIYSRRTQSESRKDQALPALPSSSQSRAGAALSPPRQEPAASVPQIEPMRRGRPTKPVSHHGSAKPSPSPLRMMDNTDPFAALDGNRVSVEDELSSRFPTLDNFSLMTDKGKKFAFEPQPEKQQDSVETGLAQRVTMALADDAFARAPSPIKVPTATERPTPAMTSENVLQHKKSLDSKETQARADPPLVTAPKPSLVSTGTMTSPSPPPTSSKPFSDRSIHRFPSNSHPARASSLTQPASDAEKKGSRLASLLREDAYRSQLADDYEPRSPTSSRPSLEGGRPTTRDVSSGVNRSRSLNFRHRPASVNIGSRPTHIKDKEIKRLDYETTFTSAEPEMPPLTHSESATNITSDVDFLKAREEEEKERRHHHRRLGSGSGHLKRASLPSIGIAGTTRLLAGKFGDAFKMFESNNDSQHQRRRSDSPSREPINSLTPIAGSEATDLSNDREPFDEAEDLSPEMRRELEKRKLEAEERRVANAAAEYRQRMAAKSGSTGARGTGGPVKAASIQNKVKSLLSEHDRPAQKTATGYGRFTGSPMPQQEESQRQISQPAEVPQARVERHHPHTMSAPASAVDLTKSQRPTAPPKPKILRSTMPDVISPTASEDPAVPHLDDDWEANFSKKYPSLAGLEMVETSITSGGPKSTATVRTKEI
ncbi:Ark- serine/threonine protein kinase [Exophiala xenobiotica]|uniref:non-specific serine/threonine protein kinase n=1 Tax=Vermiconidia calcicola TaxID=1690605 RepID=A0AAV9Q810_9PEZI|nr:Ark- serine/threonine protein kinase [Exophiala xenobiotica]KAK5535919.1 Ark- serine/threonine protein kinase [Vermiconidia calcicola]KAK5548860.1 Ark- serine/threonine protein kinase [Chaetothyriales sp. CCFEE 6169]KAK5214048.1 Ark- serine/threonine protein kinase [Exophiala xenobiotica]KAK5227192.1 Ark- serine/threonine protein kinase [Exophiala xenobiotica]